MNQNIWGPHTWFALHSISFAYPLYPTSQDKERYKTFIETLQYVLPCSVCRKNFRRNLKEFPPKLSSRKSFVYWLIDIHNEVNSLTGKERISYDKAIALYEKKYNKKIKLEEISLKPVFNLKLKYIILFVVLAMGYYLVKY